MAYEDLAPYLDYPEMDGFEIKNIRRGYARPTPEWVANDRTFHAVIYDHPQARRYAAKWAAIAYWYWRCQLTVFEIGLTLGISQSAVKRTLRRLSDRAQRVSIGPSSRGAIKAVYPGNSWIRHHLRSSQNGKRSWRSTDSANAN